MEKLWEQKWRSFRQTQPQSAPEYIRTANNVVGAPTEALLRELTHSEYSKVVHVVADIDEEDLSFDNIFQGKKRIVIPFSPGPTGDIKRLLDLFEENGWKLNVEDGTVSKEVETQRGPQVRKVKVGKALTNLVKLKEKHEDAMRELNKAQTAKRQIARGNLAPSVIDAATQAGTTIQDLEAEAQEVENKWGAEVDKVYDRIQKDFSHPNVYYISALDVASLLKHWNENNNFYKQNPEALLGEQGKYSIVMTRAPIDVLRMSDFDDITSCHSPPNKMPDSATGGGYYECAVAEAKGHGPIAYVVENSDIPEGFDWEEDEVFDDSSREIYGVTPISRLRIRKFTHNEKGYELAVPEFRVYGKTFPTLGNAVTEFLRGAQANIPQPESLDVLTRWGGSYSDSEDGDILNSYYDSKSFEEGGEAFHNDDDEDDEDDFEEVPQEEDFERKCDAIEAHFGVEHLKHTYASYEIYQEGDETPLVLMNGGMEIAFDDDEMVDVMPDWRAQQPIVKEIQDEIPTYYVDDVDFAEYNSKFVVRLMAQAGNHEPTPDGYGEFIADTIKEELEDQYAAIHNAVRRVLIKHEVLKASRYDDLVAKLRSDPNLNLYNHFEAHVNDSGSMTLTLKEESEIPLDVTFLYTDDRDIKAADKIRFGALSSDGFRRDFWTGIIRMIEEAAKQIDLPGIEDPIEDDVSIRVPFEELEIMSTRTIQDSGKVVSKLDLQMSVTGLEETEDLVVAVKLIKFIDDNFDRVVKFTNKTFVASINSTNDLLKTLGGIMEADKMVNEVLEMLE